MQSILIALLIAICSVLLGALLAAGSLSIGVFSYCFVAKLIDNFHSRA